LSGLQTAKAISTIYIQADGTVYPISAPIQRNGNVYTLTGNINSETDGIVIETNNTILEGAGHSIQGTNTPSSNGIYLSGNYNVTIRNIDIKGFESGILFDAYSTYNNIIGNTVESNVYGVNCWAYADNNNIIGNNITGNSLAGAWLAGSSNDTVTENNIAANGLGINLQSSSNDSIYHNNFVDNPTQTSIYDSPGTWDNGYPSGGNYWSDYIGTDLYRGPHQNQTGSDGIGDTPYVIDANNTDNYPLMVPFGSGHDVAVPDVQTSKTVVGLGYNMSITVIVADYGAFNETFTTTVYANTTAIYAQSMNLASGTTKTITCAWNTTNLVYGNCTISAYALPVQGETDTANNNFTGGVVTVTIPGDVDGNGRVNMGDVVSLCTAFGSTVGQSRYVPNCDIDNNGRVDMSDLIIALRHFGQHYP
ncbi:MAG: NosD domain-containing protein, partial [Candidatus Bathyarchaeia archaeon]